MTKELFFLILSFILFTGCTQQEKYAYLHEKELISKTLNQLFVQTDNRDWAKVRSCFADRVLFDVTSLAGGEPAVLTPQQIAEAWDQGLKALKAVHHQTGNFEYTIGINRAEVFCYGTAFHYLPNPSNNNTRTFVGSYNFELQKYGEDWKISMFKYNSKFIDGNLNLEGN